MTYIYVDKSKFRNFSSKSGKVSKNLNNIKSEFNSAVSSLDWEIKDSAGIDRKIRSLNNDFQEKIEKFSRMQTFLEYAYGEYDKLDSKSLKLLDAIEGASKTTKGNSSVVKWAASLYLKSMKFKAELAYKALKEVDFIGPVIGLVVKDTELGINALKKYQSKDNPFDITVSAMGDSAELVKYGVDALHKKDEFFEEIGKDVVSKGTNAIPSKGITFGEKSLIKNFRDEVGDNIKGLGLVSAVLDSVNTISENLTNEESKTQSLERNLSEGVSESVINIVKGVGLAAIATTVAAVTLPASAPAAVVFMSTAAIAAVADTGMDMITNAAVSKVTGEKYDDGFTEFVSDTVLDKGTEVFENVSDGISSLGETLKKKVGNYNNPTRNTKLQYV